MAEEAAQPESDEEEAPKKPGMMLPLVMGLAGALLLGGGAAFTISSGVIEIVGVTDTHKAAKEYAEGEHGEDYKDDGHGEKHDDAHDEKHAGPSPLDKLIGGHDLEPAAFHRMEPIAVQLANTKRARQLRVTLSIETSPDDLEKIVELNDRILDALHTLLRSIDERDLSDPAGLDRLRAQMLRRVRLVAGMEGVRDLLIVDYVIL